ncbi:MAG: methyltransferase domain-containing protein [Chloroflexi bacterium]|nr:methyltransferase domain-containing protein [Chloroflexota bacterium]
MNVDYAEVSKTYDDYRSYPEDVINRIIEFGKISEGMRILDLGCGTGTVACNLLKLINAEIIGVDISLPMLQVAREKSLEVIYANADNGWLPFADNSFNAIIGAYVIHQINDLPLLFSECYRILCDGVLVLLTSSHKQIEAQHPVIKQFFPRCIDIDKSRFPDIRKIDYLLKSAGFKDNEHEEVMVENIPIDQTYLQKVKNKYVSTYHMLEQKEFQVGVKRLESFIKSRRQSDFRERRGTLICGRK